MKLFASKRRWLVVFAAVAIVYVMLAYIMLPLLWTHHEHGPGLASLPMVTRTSAGIPGDALRDRYPEASDISSPPCLLRLLPAGADAGWDLHPLESAALHGARDMQPPIPTFADGGYLKSYRTSHAVFSLEVEFRNAFNGRFWHF